MKPLKITFLFLFLTTGMSTAGTIGEYPKNLTDAQFTDPETEKIAARNLCPDVCSNRIVPDASKEVRSTASLPGLPPVSVRRGTWSLSLGVPLVSLLYGTWKDGNLEDVGIFGAEIGVGWNYAHRRSIRFTSGIVGLFPKLGAVNCDVAPGYVKPDFDTHCAIPDQRRVYMNLTHGHEFEKGFLSYGPSVNFVNIFNDDKQNVNHWSAGVNLSCGVRIKDFFLLILNYNPTFLRFEKGNVLSYEHSAGLGMRFDIRLKSRQPSPQ